MAAVFLRIRNVIFVRKLQWEYLSRIKALRVSAFVAASYFYSKYQPLPYIRGPHDGYIPRLWAKKEWLGEFDYRVGPRFYRHTSPDSVCPQYLADTVNIPDLSGSLLANLALVRE